MAQPTRLLVERSGASACRLALLVAAAMLTPTAASPSPAHAGHHDARAADPISGRSSAIAAVPSAADESGALRDEAVPFALSDVAAPIVQNSGQWPDYVDFAVGAFGDGPWLVDGGILIGAPEAGVNGAAVMWTAELIRIDGVDPDARWEPSGRMDSPRISYFVGADPRRHQSAVPLWREASHRLLDGRRLVVNGGGELGWSWRVVDDGAPTASTAAVEPAGAIAAVEPAHAIAADAPFWATYFGGRSDEKLYTLDVDLTGSIYVSGSSTSPDLPASPGAFDGTLRGSQSAYVAKLSPEGARMEYLTFLGGGGIDYVKAIAVDDETGDLIVGGDTTSADFPTTADAFRPRLSGAWDAFITRIDHVGTGLRYSTYFGGSPNDYIEDLEVGQGGAITVLLETWSRDLPTHMSAVARYGMGDSDAYVVRFDPTSMAPTLATYVGGSGDDCHDCSLAVGSDDTIYVAGWTTSDDLPLSLGALRTTRRGKDGYVMALDRSGDSYRYGTLIGGSGDDCSTDCEITVDGDGRVFIIGSTSSPDFPTTPGAFRSAPAGGDDVFVAAISRDGTALEFSTLFGGSGIDVGHRIVPRRDGIWVMGKTGSSDLPTTPDAFMRTGGGGDDIFLAIFSLDASRLLYSTYLGGSAGECEFNCGMVVREGAFILGATSHSTDAPTTAGVFAERSAGWAEGYVARLVPVKVSDPITPSPSPSPPPSPSPTPGCPPGHVCSTFTPPWPVETSSATPTSPPTPTFDHRSLINVRYLPIAYRRTD